MAILFKFSSKSPIITESKFIPPNVSLFFKFSIFLSLPTSFEFSILLISLFMISMNMERELLLSTLSFIALVAVRMVPVINGFNIEISNAMYNQKAFDRYFEEENINLKGQIFDKKTR